MYKQPMRANLILLATYLVAAGITATVEIADYKIREAKKKKREQKLEDEKDGVVWTIEADDVVEIYRNCEVV